MVKFLKPGKVVIILNGKYAGKKAVIVKAFDDGNEKRPYPHALVAGIDRAPQAVFKGQTKVARRTRVRPFIKVVNYNHLMPTRYNLENLELKGVVDEHSVQADKKKKSKNKLRTLLQERYNSGSNKWFFTKLRF
eukprot:TRINITY_DN10003_c0_g1_i1.p1 TRINITY_DN10003_c0_g1~~TRINITY_DN10003_c0_g1_i1.p1  ORF type:complete len:134 (-),score=46.85 TRINITY_DN10003_c0_g1_i1:352-753(-)